MPSSAVQSDAKPGHSTESAGASIGSRPRLTHIDGIRGLAALYVVAYHCYLDCVPDLAHPGMGHWKEVATNWLQFGHVSVSIFIVLSGYCLMLPLARTPDRFSLRDFILRRSRRILPPYYAALFLTLALTIAIPALTRPTHTAWDVTQPALAVAPIVSHVFLVQDLSDNWVYKISDPMWSMAIEWQIYFVFGLLLIPLWRRFGMSAVLTLTYAAGIILDRFHFANTCSHFVFLFGLGMLGALLAHSKDPLIERWRTVPWVMVGLLCAAAFIYMSHGKGLWMNDHIARSDTLVGFAALALLVACDRTNARAGRRSAFAPVLRLLQSPLAAGLGLFSYSLYLIHAPILALVHIGLGRYNFSQFTTLTLQLGISISLSIALAYGFFRLFERPFLNLKLK